MIIDGKKIAEKIRADVACDVAALKQSRGITPGLAVIIAGDNPASLSYVKSKRKACESAGMYSVEHALKADATETQVLAIIAELNADLRVHGILVQLPLPRHIDESKIIFAINPAKDADGIHPVSLGRLLLGVDGPRPCTPAGIQKLLESTGAPISGSRVVVLGRSNIVGKPVAAMLMQKAKNADATVTVCHSRSRDLPSITRQADILIAAIGSPEFVTASMVKDGAVVIDVGINRVPDGSREKGYRVVGDVKFDEVAPKCKAISPVPGGVGPMTIAMLLHNTVQAAGKTV
jgi:methylenetetrahydrofolate dehydrogenase (NADP+)/methenyltetrahydrofolate cyclohydrolase